jgi:hypothetical protein
MGGVRIYSPFSMSSSCSCLLEKGGEWLTGVCRIELARVQIERGQLLRFILTTWERHAEWKEL